MGYIRKKVLKVVLKKFGLHKQVQFQYNLLNIRGHM